MRQGQRRTVQCKHVGSSSCKHHSTSSSSARRPPHSAHQRDSMARKKDERAARKKQQKVTSSCNVVSADDKSFAAQLSLMGLKVREVIGDGNCLFRALADQLDGDDHAHSRHRQDVVRYITEHRADFEPFIEDDVPFTQHVQNLAQDGTYGGNDSIVAFARLHKLTVVIHQLESPAWEVHGETVDGTSSKPQSLVRQLHISYHNGDHYASVRRLQDNTDSPANVHISGIHCNHSHPLTEVVDKPCQHQASSVSADSTPLHLPHTTPTDNCTRSHTDDLQFIERVIEITRCPDRHLVSDICAEAGYFDLDLVCSHVLAFMEGVRSSSSSATSDGELPVETAPVHGSAAAAAAINSSMTSCAVGGAKAKSSRASRRQRKQEKKARAAQRHQLNTAATRHTADSEAGTDAASGRCHGRPVASSDDDDVTSPFVITQQLKVLQI